MDRKPLLHTMGLSTVPGLYLPVQGLLWSSRAHRWSKSHQSSRRCSKRLPPRRKGSRMRP